MAVAEFDTVVIPAKGAVLNGLFNLKVELPGLGFEDLPIHFKDRNDFDQREGDGIGGVLRIVLFDEQVIGLGRVARRGDFYINDLLQVFLNSALVDVQFVDFIGHRAVTLRFQFSPDQQIGGAVVSTEILTFKRGGQVQHLPLHIRLGRPARQPRHRIIGMG